MADTDTSKCALLTGAAGLLGRRMAARLAASGWQVVALTHADLDITNRDEVHEKIVRVAPTVVINCAATPDVDACERQPDWAFAVNEQGPRFLAAACRETNAEFVHVSTDYVFDGTKSGYYTQDDTPNPLSVYAKTKLTGEQAARAEHSLTYIIRTSWIFGTGGKNFGSRVIELARSGAKLKGVSDQTSIPTYADDLAARIEEIIARGVHELYHVTNTGVTTWLEFARLALDLAGLKGVPIEPVTRAELNQIAPRPQNSALRCLVSEQIGLAPIRDWRAALTEFVEEQVKST